MDKCPLLVANWKLSLSHKAATETAKAIRKLGKQLPDDVHIVLCPSFPSLPAVSTEVHGMERVYIGAQNVHWEESGAWTGEVSISQITPFVSHCIVGHSERRRLVGETDEQIAAKVALVIRHGVTAIACIGENWEQRQSSETDSVLRQQVSSVIAPLSRAAISRLVIAYEPVWAISANNPDEPPEPNEVGQNVVLIRKIVAEHFDTEVAKKIRVLYGGSVDQKNIGQFVREPGVDGALVGSASLIPMQVIAMATSITVK